jgi:hypothetical protein
MKRKKIRVNITVDQETLEKAKTKLHLFGGKLSTLFNTYLEDFVSSMDKKYSDDQKMISAKIKDIEDRLKRLEDRKA